MKNHYAFTCPHCQRLHDDIPESEVDNGSYVCQGCGRKLHVYFDGGEMTCENCGCTRECDNCIDSINVGKLCRPGPCDWQPTLALDIEKCQKCFDIRRIVPPSPITHATA